MIYNRWTPGCCCGYTACEECSGVALIDTRYEIVWGDTINEETTVPFNTINREGHCDNILLYAPLSAMSLQPAVVLESAKNIILWHDSPSLRYNATVYLKYYARKTAHYYGAHQEGTLNLICTVGPVIPIEGLTPKNPARCLNGYINVGYWWDSIRYNWTWGAVEQSPQDPDSYLGPDLSIIENGIQLPETKRHEYPESIGWTAGNKMEIDVDFTVWKTEYIYDVYTFTPDYSDDQECERGHYSGSYTKTGEYSEIINYGDSPNEAKNATLNEINNRQSQILRVDWSFKAK